MNERNTYRYRSDCESLTVDGSMLIIICSCQSHVLVMVTVPYKTRRGRKEESTFRDKDVPSNDLMLSCAWIRRKALHRKKVLHHTFSGKVNEYRLHSLPLLFFTLLTPFNPRSSLLQYQLLISGELLLFQREGHLSLASPAHGSLPRGYHLRAHPPPSEPLPGV